MPAPVDRAVNPRGGAKTIFEMQGVTYFYVYAVYMCMKAQIT
jgi:hypothetical protein